MGYEPGFISEEALQMVSGGVRGNANIKNAVHDVQQIVMDDFMAEMESWAAQFMPYRTGRMFEAAVAVIQESTARRLRMGGGSCEYAAYVDAFDPVIHWTNPSSVYHWFRKMLAHADVVVPRLIRDAIRDVGLAAMTGQGIGELEGEILVD